MTEEDRQLLCKDLCGRLPHGVKYRRDSWNFEWDQEMSVVEVLEDIDKEGYINYHKVYKVDDIKPYLRPMSSMTEEEKKEFINYADYEVEESVNGRYYEYCLKGYVGTPETPSCNYNAIDWLNAHHFDYRGLIEKGLALEAPEGMYNN